MPILQSLLRGEPTSGSGTHYHVDAHQTFPGPSRPGGPPILIGAGKPRMLRLAGRYADTVGLLTVSVSSGAVEDEIAPRRTAAVRQRIDLIRDGAADRFNTIELQIMPEIFPDAAAAASAHGWAGLDAAVIADMPAILLGEPKAIVEQMLERRETLGISYYAVADDQFEAFAPIVRALRNR